MRPHFIAVLTVLALCRMILPVQAQQRGPIIDMHVHANPDRSVQRVVAVMDEFHVVKAFLSNSLAPFRDGMQETDREKKDRKVAA